MSLNFNTAPQTITRPDERGRVTLGRNITEGVSRYDVFVNEETGEVLLKPYKEIPIQEAWLYKNNEANRLVVEGLTAAKEGKFSERDFEKSNWIEDVGDDS